jgi:hypothetical protein
MLARRRRVACFTVAARPGRSVSPDRSCTGAGFNPAVSRQVSLATGCITSPPAATAPFPHARYSLRAGIFAERLVQAAIVKLAAFVGPRASLPVSIVKNDRIPAHRGGLFSARTFAPASSVAFATNRNVPKMHRLSDRRRNRWLRALLSAPAPIPPNGPKVGAGFRHPRNSCARADFPRVNLSARRIGRSFQRAELMGRSVSEDFRAVLRVTASLGCVAFVVLVLVWIAYG